jgi:WD40 repeat protein/transcriptional regulator with XRE-family HTH domain
MSGSIPGSTLEKFTTFGDLLRFLRRRAGITQMELSIAVGYSDAQISRLEQNLRPPDIPTIEARFVPALGLEEEPAAVARLLELAAHVRRENAPALGLCPYKGLNYFEESDSDLFVGREEQTSRLVERILALRSSPTSNRFLAVIGASGSGKSSLLHAGLIPAIRWNQKSTDWQIHVLTPTAHPLESLAASLFAEGSSLAGIAALMDDLARDQRSLQIFARQRTKMNYPLLIVVDQFEELFTLCRAEEERVAFMDNLLTASAEVDGPALVVVALRADFYAHCADYPLLREALAACQEYIGAMNEEELKRAIEEPARRGRWEFEQGLVNLLLHEVGREPGALPLLSHALLETWQRRRGRVMTLSGYTSSGGVRGAIAETAEAIFTDQLSHEQQALARRIFLRLTELGEETATGDTRRRATLDELILKPEDKDMTHALIKRLADARLIVTHEDTVEVAHEALIREWPRLRGWLEDNREGLRLHRHLTGSAQEWLSLDRMPDLLYRGARLTQAREWADAHTDELNPLECEFLEASIAWAEREEGEREAQRRRELETAQKLAESERQRAEEQELSAAQLKKRARYLTGAFLIAILMALTTLFFSSQARRTAIAAQHDKILATSRELAAASRINLSVDPERSLLLALQSISTTQNADGTVLPQSLEALHWAIVSSPIRMTLKGMEDGVLSAAYSPDGKQLAAIGMDGTVIQWEAVTGRELRRIPGSTQANNFVSTQRISYSPDGKSLFATDENRIKIYDPQLGTPVRELSGQAAAVTAIAVSRDGKFLASGALDGSVLLWDLVSDAPVQPLEGHTQAVENLTFSPDGKWLVTAGDDGALKIWDVSSGALLKNFSEFGDVVLGVTFSPDGKQLAFTDGTLQMWKLSDQNGITYEELFNIPGAAPDSFSADGSRLAGYVGNDIKIWDAASGRELLTLTGHRNWIMGLAFSPDGSRLASTSKDGSIKVWSLAPGGELTTVASPGTVFGTRIASSPDGKQFLTNGGDGSAVVWNAQTGRSLFVVHGSAAEVVSVAYSPDGKRFATGSLDGKLFLWDTSSGRELLGFAGHESGIRDIAFSPRSDLLATGSFDGTARIWDARTGELLQEITGHRSQNHDLVLGVAFSPDGRALATSGTDGTAMTWDVKTGSHLLTLKGHTLGIPDIAYSPDGSMIATGSGDGTAILWDAKTGSQNLALRGHTSGISSVQFSPDGSLLATGSDDNTVKLWDVRSGEEVLTLPGSQGGVSGLAFDPGGTQLMVAGHDGIVRAFLLQTDDLLKLAQSRVTRSLSMEECKKYLHATTCPGQP